MPNEWLNTHNLRYLWAWGLSVHYIYFQWVYYLPLDKEIRKERNYKYVDYPIISINLNKYIDDDNKDFDQIISPTHPCDPRQEEIITNIDTFRKRFWDKRIILINNYKFKSFRLCENNNECEKEENETRRKAICSNNNGVVKDDAGRIVCCLWNVGNVQKGETILVILCGIRFWG